MIMGFFRENHYLKFHSMVTVLCSEIVFDQNMQKGFRYIFIKHNFAVNLSVKSQKYVSSEEPLSLITVCKSRSLLVKYFLGTFLTSGVTRGGGQLPRAPNQGCRPGGGNVYKWKCKVTGCQ